MAMNPAIPAPIRAGTATTRIVSVPAVVSMAIVAASPISCSSPRLAVSVMGDTRTASPAASILEDVGVVVGETSIGLVVLSEGVGTVVGYESSGVEALVLGVAETVVDVVVDMVVEVVVVVVVVVVFSIVTVTVAVAHRFVASQTR